MSLSYTSDLWKTSWTYLTLSKSFPKFNDKDHQKLSYYAICGEYFITNRGLNFNLFIYVTLLFKKNCGGENIFEMENLWSENFWHEKFKIIEYAEVG